MAEVRCPRCGKPNPDDLEICQFCDASLTSGTGSLPGGFPDLPQGGMSQEDAAGQQQGATSNGSQPQAGQEPPQNEPGENETALPAWLRSLRETSEPSPAGNIGDGVPGAGFFTDPEPSDSTGFDDDDSHDLLRGQDKASGANEGESLDWLANLRSQAGSVSSPESPEAPEAEQTPDATAAGGSDHPASEWLSRLGGEPAGTDHPEGTLPDWLSDFRSKAARSEEPSAEAEEELPDWLAGLPSVPGEAPIETPNELPEWLSDLQEKTKEPQAPETPSHPAQDGQDFARIPQSALDEGASAGNLGESGPEPGQKPSEPVTDWLAKLKSDIQDAGQAPEISPGPAPVIPAPLPDQEEEEMPDWLANIGRTTPLRPATPALSFPDEGEIQNEAEQAPFSMGAPDLISSLRPERGMEIPPAVPEEARQEDIKQTELPSWVQAMRPVESVLSAASADEPDGIDMQEASGPLAGLQGVLPSTPGLEAIRKPPMQAHKLQASSNQQRYATQLEKMITDEGQARVLKPSRPTSNRVWRMAISFILILVVVIPLVAGKSFTPDILQIPSEWMQTSDLLAELPAGAPALLVFDYDPALFGEMEASAAAVIDAVLSKGTRLALVSTSPTGPALAEQFLRSTQEKPLDAGLVYANLGYLAGGPAGIQSFVTDPVGMVKMTLDGGLAWETSVLQGVSQVSDFALLIILTDNADTGRMWIEQTRATNIETPILMILSAQAEPMIRPYYESGQIQGLVSGLVGGKAFEQGSGNPGLARRYWDSFGLGILSAVVMIAAGATWSAFISWRARKKDRMKV